MPRWTERPLPAVAVLLAAAALVVFPNLGATSLWDDDEGVNAECTREMMETPTWIVPTFNWDLRTAKPILLYWVMRGSFAAFGENEFAARVPSAAAFVGVVLAVYGLGRSLFGGSTGFVAGLVVCSTMGLVYLGRAATTDSLLILFTTFFFLAFWRGSANGGRGWFVPCGVLSGLAMLTKGPAVGLLLPAAVVGAYLLWTRQLTRLLDRRWLLGVLAWVLVAVPWYAAVASETKGEWPRAFFPNEHVGRASEPKENHRGVPVVYEFAVVCVLFAPWSAFLAASVWKGFQVSRERKASASPSEGAGEKLLLCWVSVYFLACSAAATKLPHYIAPAYPALGLLTARTLTRWAAGELVLPKWVLPAGLIGFAVTGVVTAVGQVLASGVIPLSGEDERLRTFPGLERWAWVGLFPLGAAGVGWWLVKCGNRAAAVGVMGVGAVLFIAMLAAFAPQEVDRRKAVRELVRESGARALDREARVASLDYSQPSITYYTARRVERLDSPAAAAQFLAFDIESYLFVPEPIWENTLADMVKTRRRVASRRYDFYRHCHVLVVTNR